MKRHVAIAATLSAALLAGGCNRQQPGVYAIAPAEAFNLLKADKLIALRRNRQCGVVIDFQPQAVSANEIRWTVFSGGREMLWFRALLTPVSATQTKVAVEVQPGENGKELYAGDYFPPRPVVAQPMHPALEEAIAAILQKRAFDPERAPSNDSDNLCDDQRGVVEEGHIFSVDDPLGMPPRAIPQD